MDINSAFPHPDHFPCPHEHHAFPLECYCFCFWWFFVISNVRPPSTTILSCIPTFFFRWLWCAASRLPSPLLRWFRYDTTFAPLEVFGWCGMMVAKWLILINWAPLGCSLWKGTSHGSSSSAAVYALHEVLCYSALTAKKSRKCCKVLTLILIQGVDVVFFSSMMSCVKYGKTELQVDNISRVSNLFACRRQLIFSKKQFKDDEQSLHE